MIGVYEGASDDGVFYDAVAAVDDGVTWVNKVHLPNLYWQNSTH